MNEKQVLKNFICMMPKTYRQRNINWIIVRDILLANTSTSGSTSCRNKCIELGIDPDGYSI